MSVSPYGSTSSYGDRIIGVLRLDPRAFRDVEQDTNANGQAAMTVVIAAIASGIGVILGRDIIQNLVGTAISSILQWIVFSFVACKEAVDSALPRSAAGLGRHETLVEGPRGISRSQDGQRSDAVGGLR